MRACTDEPKQQRTELLWEQRTLYNIVRMSKRVSEWVSVCEFWRWFGFFSTGTIDEWRINNQRMQYKVEGENNKGPTTDEQRKPIISQYKGTKIFRWSFIFSHRMSHPCVFFRFTNEHRHFISFLLTCSFPHHSLRVCVCVFVYFAGHF